MPKFFAGTTHRLMGCSGAVLLLSVGILTVGYGVYRLLA